ncbi:MAG: FKBP-type peptidyl-prolyl cis-trans isomerase [Bacteroidota bacterium]
MLNNIKHSLFICLLALAVFSCTKPAPQEQSEAAEPTTTATESTSSANQAVAVTVPFEVVDSSAVEDLGGGIKMYVIERGSGVIPETGSNVVINYHGMLTDGTVFDSSFGKQGVMDFNLNQLITGWQVALTAVETGSKIKIIVPPEMGYGAQGQGQIPPNSTLIFDIDLISTY